MGRRYYCDRCGSEDNVSTAIFEYWVNSGMLGNRKVEKSQDLCERCLKIILDTMNKKRGE